MEWSWNWNMNDWFRKNLHLTDYGSTIAQAGKYASDALLGTNFIGNDITKSVAEQNLQFQKDTLAKNEELLRESWDREDNAVQRRVADLKSAGLSPTLAAGSAAATSGPIQLKAPSNEYQYQNPFGGGVLDALAKVTSIKSGELQNELLEKQIEHFGEPDWLKALDKVLERFGDKGWFNTTIQNFTGAVENAMDALGVDHGKLDFTPKFGFTFAKPPAGVPTTVSEVVQSVEKSGGATVEKDGSRTYVTFDSAKAARDWYLSIGGTSFEWYNGVAKYGSPTAFINHIIETGGNYF